MLLLVVAYVGLLGRPSLAAAQTQSGTLTGRVVDGSGAAVAGAVVTLRSADQGHVTIGKTNEQGEYTFNGLPPASYRLQVKAPSFAGYTVDNISVSADANVQINASLRPIGESASVTVEADALTLDTRSATVGTVIDNTLVENLPLDGNNIVEVAALLPGVTDVNAPTTFTSDTGGPTYNVSGSRANQNLLLLDGALYNNLYNNTGLNFPPRQALQEVSVQLNNFKAQYGRNVGSVFNVLTKRGQNNFHGTLYEYAQNRAFNAYDYISKQNPKLVQNQFGATIGGPIRRDKLFFFISYQDLRSVAAVTAQAPTLTTAERGLMPDGVTPRPCQNAVFAASGSSCASFSEDIPNGPKDCQPDPTTGKLPSGCYVNNPVRAGVATTAVSALNSAYAVSTGKTGTSPCVALLTQVAATTIDTNELPSICFNPTSVNFLKRFPLPTLAVTGAMLPYAVTSANQPRNDQEGLIHVDWNLGRHTIGARYYQTSVDDRTANGVASGLGIAGYEINANIGNLHFALIDDTWVITPNILNVARLAYKRYIYNISPTDPSTVEDFGSVLAQPGHPTLPRVNIASRFQIGTASQNFSNSVNEDVEFNDALTYTHGRHNFQLGAQYLRLQYKHIYESAPTLNFSNSYTDITAADFLLGFINTINVGNGSNVSAIQHDVYMYAQDDWRATSKLTLNLGVRYELPFLWYQPNAQAATFIPGYQSTRFPTAPPGVAFVGDPGVERSLAGTSYNNLAPRFGLAYDVFGNGQTALRAGFGIFYDAINAQVVGLSQPFHFQENVSNPAGGLSNPLLGQTQIPDDYVVGQAPQFRTPYSITFPDRNFQTPYSMAFNLGVQQHIRHSTTVELNYVGRAGRHQAIGFDLNPAIYDCSGYFYQLNPALYCLSPAATSISSFQSNYTKRVKYPGFNAGGSGVLDYMTVGSSSYNALQVIFTSRASKGLTTIASYTYSKSLDESSNGTSIANSSDQPDLTAKRAVSDFDTRQILNIGFHYRLPHVNSVAAPLRGVVNGWMLGGIYNARTGHPFNITTAADQTLRDELPENASFTVGGYHPLSSSRHRAEKANQWFNTANICAFAPSGPTIPIYPNCTTLPGGYGNIPRNFFFGPAFINTTLSVSRTFVLQKDAKRNFVFRADAINAFNTPNLGQPQSVISANASKNGTFGSIISTVGSNGAVGTNGRRIQLSGTLNF